MAWWFAVLAILHGLIRVVPQYTADGVRKLWECRRILSRGSPKMAAGVRKLWEFRRILSRGSPNITCASAAKKNNSMPLPGDRQNQTSTPGGVCVSTEKTSGTLQESDTRRRRYVYGMTQVALFWRTAIVLICRTARVTANHIKDCCGKLCKDKQSVCCGSPYPTRALSIKKNCPDPGGGDDKIRHNWVDGYSNEKLAECQLEDADLGKVIQWLRMDGKPSRDEVAAESPAARQLWLMWDQLKLVAGVLFRTFECVDGVTYDQLVVPWSLQKKILQSVHDSVVSGHLGVKKTISKVKKCFYWHEMRSSIRDWVRKCLVCSARKHPPKRARAAMKKYTAGFPLDRVSTDILGPFPVSDQGNRYILTVMDQFTRWVEAYAIPDFTAQTVAQGIVF
jgi:hypothetical protein